MSKEMKTEEKGMPDYSKSKIYKIVCNITGETYYGSTVQSLAKRVGQHRDDFKRWKNGKGNCVKSYDIIERGDYDYSLVEECPCDSKEQLHVRERYWIENNECVNKYIPGRTFKEWYDDTIETRREVAKVYRDQNKDIVNRYKQKYRENNKEKEKERMRIYRENNKEKEKERHIKYYQDNKEKRLDYQIEYRNKQKELNNDKLVCGCGSEITKANLTRHLKSKKHLVWVDSQSE